MPLPLPISVEDLESLVAKYGTPLQLYSEAGIRDTTRALINAFTNPNPNPNPKNDSKDDESNDNKSSDKSESYRGFASFRQFFAVKALPNPAILSMVVDEGCGLDCSSTSELHIATKLGVTGENVMFTSNYTSQADLAYAFDLGVVMNLDDLSLVESLVQVRGRTPELISFRLNPGLGRTDSETVSNVLGGPDAKFGIPPFQIVEAYRQAKKHGSSRFGIHMMTGSCVRNTEYWEATVKELLRAVAKVKSELGIDFEFINIGGGLGIPYRPEESRVDVNEVAATVRKTFENNLKVILDDDDDDDDDDGENRGDNDGDGSNGKQKVIELFSDGKEPKLYMENGRFITGPHGYLVARCQAVKDTYERYYGLDACMANLMRPGMYNAYHHITVPTAKARNAPIETANVVGTLCENNDWFAKHRSLPRAEVGDLFVIHDSGAHAHSMGFNYNGKLHAPEVLLRPDGSDALIRKRQTVETLYDDTVVPPDLNDSLIANSPRKKPPRQNRLTAQDEASDDEEGNGNGEEGEEEEGYCVVQ